MTVFVLKKLIDPDYGTSDGWSKAYCSTCNYSGSVANSEFTARIKGVNCWPEGNSARTYSKYTTATEAKERLSSEHYGQLLLTVF